MGKFVCPHNLFGCVCFDMVELDIADLMSWVATVPFIFWFTDKIIGVGIRGNDRLDFVYTKLEEAMVATYGGAKDDRFANLFYGGDDELGFIRIHSFSQFGILGKPLSVDSHETTKTNKQWFFKGDE